MWLEAKTDLIKEILNELLKHSSNKSVKYTPKVEILLQEIIALSNNTLDYGLIVKCLIELKKRNRRSLKSFKDFYFVLFEAHKKLESIVWDIFLPYKNQIVTKKFKIHGLNFSIISQKQFRKIVSQEKLKVEVDNTAKYRLEKFVLPKYFIRIQMTGHNINHCWAKIRNRFTMLQGAFDFGMLSDIWIETEAAMTCFIHPEWITIQNPNGQLEFGTFQIFDKRTFKSRSLMRIKPTKNLLKYMSQEPEADSTKSLICDSFRLYAQAMESIHNYNCFLSLWQLIENACISETFSGNTNEVIKRINVIVEETRVLDFRIDGLYSTLSKKRNELVHKGVNNINNSDLNVLKMLSETFINWLLEKEKILKTKNHINEYFKLRTRNNKEKKAIIDVINYMEKKHFVVPFVHSIQ